MSDLFSLTDAQMALWDPSFQRGMATPLGDWQVLSSIIFISRNGLRWCDAPKDHGSLETMERQGRLR